jgi:hypothetical protein
MIGVAQAEATRSEGDAPEALILFMERRLP